MVLDRLQKRAWSKPLSYLAHMLRLYRFVHRGATNPWESMEYGSLRNRYATERTLLKGEWEGELYEQQEMVGEG